MPDITAQTADGVTHSFPEGTRPEVMDRVMREYTQQNISRYNEAGAAANPPQEPLSAATKGVLGRPAMPGVASRYAGPQGVALSPAARASRDKPMEVAKDVAAGTLIGLTPELAVPGITATMAGGAATGAGTYAAERGLRGELPDLKGLGIAAATGGLAGPLLEKVGGPLLGKILRSARGEAAPATTAAAEQLPEVLHAPIKSGPFPNTPPGNVQNIPRNLLPGIAARTGDPAAVAEISRVTGRPSLYVGEDFPAPRSVQSFPSEPPAASASPITSTYPTTPTAKPTLSNLPEYSNIPQVAGPETPPDVDALADKLRSQGATRDESNLDAKRLIDRLNSPSNTVRAMAKQSYDRIMSGGQRIGNAANYYGLERRGQ